MWSTADCKYCGFPRDETRTPGQIEIDDAEGMEELDND